MPALSLDSTVKISEESFPLLGKREFSLMLSAGKRMRQKNARIRTPQCVSMRILGASYFEILTYCD